MPALGWLLIVAAVAGMLAILVWAPRYRPCPACGRRVRVDAPRCGECGRDLAPKPTALPEGERERIVRSIGEEMYAAITKWIAAAGVEPESLSPRSWLLLAIAYGTIEIERRDLLREGIDMVQELAPSSRARLLQVGDGSITIRESLIGCLVLREVGYDAATRTFELTGIYEPSPTGDVGPLLSSLPTVVAEGRDSAGNPVETVRVVFLWEWQARRAAAGPLRDAGAKVFYQGDQGQLVEVAD